MNPETAVLITPAIEDAAIQTFDAHVAELSREFARGQNRLSDFFDSIRRIPTSRERIVPLVQRVRDSKAFLAEVIGRRQTAASPDDATFRSDLARNISQSNVQLSNEVADRAAEATHTTDPIGTVYRGYLQADRAVALGGALGYLAANNLGWVSGEAGLWISDFSVAAAAIGAMDLSRRGFLDWTTRHLRDLPSNIAEIIRRRASVIHSNITGDFIDQPGADTLNTLGNALQVHTELRLRDQLEAYQAERPFLHIGDPNWAPSLRAIIRPALDISDETEELVRAREVSKLPRLARGLLALAILGTAGYIHLNRLIYCGVTGFPEASDESQARFGQPDRLSIYGKAEDRAFRARYGHSPDRNNPDDQRRLAQDRAEKGYDSRVNSLSHELRDLNPQLQWVDEDRFIGAGLFYEPCPPGQQRAFQRLRPRIVQQEGGGIRIAFGQ